MSILFPRYSGFPPEIFELGLAANMSHSAFRLYIFLCRHSDRMSNLSLSLTGGEIHLQTGISVRALTEARSNLQKLGLVQCSKSIGGSYTYLLCDPLSKRAFPGSTKEKQRYVKKEKPVSEPEDANGRESSRTAPKKFNFEPAQNTRVKEDTEQQKSGFQMPIESPTGKIYFNVPNGYDR